MLERTARGLFRFFVLLALLGAYIALQAIRDGHDVTDTGFVQAYTLFAVSTVVAFILSLLPAKRADVGATRQTAPAAPKRYRELHRVTWRPESTPALSPSARSRQDHHRRGPVHGRLVVPMR